MTVWPFIEAEKAEHHSVKRACELLEVSRSAYYQQRTHTPSVRKIADAELKARIVTIHAESNGTYGAPRIHRCLRDEGIHVGRKRVARLMVEASLAGRCRRRFVRTTVVDPEATQRLDLICRNFAPGDDLDRRWCGDITYIPTDEGWAFLSTVIDLASRKVVGWELADHLRTGLVAGALEAACRWRRPPKGVVFHSDRGCQYTSYEFAAVAKRLGVTLSVGRTGSCYDNAVAEAFFASLKDELVDRRRWRTIAELRQAVFVYIEGWFNTRRLHSTLGYLSPARYEADIFNRGTDAIAS
jgi:putative transposase